MSFKRAVALALLLITLTGCAKTSEKAPSSSSSAPFGTSEEQKKTDGTEIYSITYDVGDGINSGLNPTTYTSNDEITLLFPIRKGYSFLGWQSIDSASLQRIVTIPKGSQGDKSYTAVWEELSDQTSAPSHNQGVDIGIPALTGGAKVSEPIRVGDRGQNVYAVKTAYTDIATDGVRDNIYDYGFYIESALYDSPAAYADRDVSFKVWVVIDDRKTAHFFAEITDPEIVVTDELWNKKWWHCDSFQLYLDYSDEAKLTELYTFGASSDRKYVNNPPDDFFVAITDKGFNVEFSIDNLGKPIEDETSFGVGFFYNDCYGYKSADDYLKHTVRTPSRHNPATEKYETPNYAEFDSLIFLKDSATGRATEKKNENVKTGDMLTDIVKGTAGVSVVTAKNASSSTVLAAKEIVSMLRKYSGNRVYLHTDDEERPQVDYEISVGKTNRKNTRAHDAALAINGYGIFLDQSDISLLGWGSESIGKMSDLMFACLEHASNGGSGYSLSSRYVGYCDNALADMPKLEGSDFVTESYGGAFQIVKLNASLDEYEAYLKKLASWSFSEQSKRTLQNMHYAIYYNKNVLINLNFDGKTIRVVTEPRDRTAIHTPQLHSGTDKVSITQVGNTGMCYIVTLSDGRLLIVDSGNNKKHDLLLSEMRRVSGEEHPTVAAWIFTHFHQDHVGGFVDFVLDGYLSEITLESIIYNFPEQQVLDTASSIDIANMKVWEEVLSKTECVVYTARSGNLYAFSGCEIEILTVYEDLMPYNVYYDKDDTNSTSMIFTLTLNGKKFTVTGDASQPVTTLAARRFKEYLRSDILQLSHHGKGDSEKGNSADFYRYVGASTVFVPYFSGIYGNPEKTVAESAERLFNDKYTSATLTLT